MLQTSNRPLEVIDKKIHVQKLFMKFTKKSAYVCRIPYLLRLRIHTLKTSHRLNLITDKILHTFYE